MIVWSLREGSIADEAGDITHHRWILDVGRWYASLETQHRRKGEEWTHHHGDYFNITVNGNWCWGSQHVYYDGPHCSFSIGIIHFNWRYWWNCRRCHQDGFGD